MVVNTLEFNEKREKASKIMAIFNLIMIIGLTVCFVFDFTGREEFSIYPLSIALTSLSISLLIFFLGPFTKKEKKEQAQRLIGTFILLQVFMYFYYFR